MENTKQAVLRKLFSGVEQANAGESSNRCARNQRASKSSAAVVLPSRGMPVTGSVRERAKAFEARYAADSTAYVPSPTPPGSAGQKPHLRVAKTSTNKPAQTAAAAPQSAISPTPGQQQAQGASVDVRAQPPDKENHKDLPDTNRKPAVLTSKTAFPPQQQSPSKRVNAYELPKTPNCPNSGTPQRLDKHVSSPPAQRPNGQGTKPTLRAGAFQAARSRSNSTPRPSEWFTSSSPSSTTKDVPQTKSEVMQRPNPRPQSVILAAPVNQQHAPRVSALPISQSRKSRVSLESVQASPVDGSEAVSPPSRPTVPQRSVSSHSAFATRPVKDEAVMRPEAQQTTLQNTFVHAPVSAKSDNASRKSTQMERAKSSPGAQAASDAKPPRPRSLTLTASNPAELDSMFQEFLDSLNLSETVSRRMMTVDARVKLDMLRSGTPASTVSKATGQSLTGGGAQARMPIPQFGEAGAAAKPSKKRPKMLRKMKSFMSNKDTTETPEGFMMLQPTSPRMNELASLSTSKASFDHTKEIVSQAAAAQAHLIKTKPLKNLDPVKDVRKLRVLLRNENLAWVTEWVKFGGYRGLMERLHEVVTLEWREEQHDDQVLLELLKCFRGLLMSQPGRQCLASFSPSPFRPLIELLFSDKKPGELASRQCIAEIMNGLFEVFTDAAPTPILHDEWRKPWSSPDNFGYLDKQSMCSANGSRGSSQSAPNAKSPQLPDLHFDRRAGKGSEGSSTWESAGFEEGYSFVSGAGHIPSHPKQERSDGSSVGPSSASAAFNLVKSLVAGPPNEKEEAQVYFIKSTRKTRVFKLWMDEVIGVLSDYFWIFCHSSNSYWRLENIQEDQLEEPKVPGGMTGGVEYEAMEYCAAHLRLLNRLCKYCPPGDEAFDFHSDLFASGIDKVLLTLRKCSTVYYPQIHLELARYIDLCLSSGYPLHPNIRRYIEPVSSLKQSISAGKLAGQAPQQKPQAAKKGHQRSRTDGQILISK